MRAPGTVYIGTSGWHYPHWKGPFYPDDHPTDQFLTYYARRLHSAEINSSFYRLPGKETLRAWRDAVPDDFVFAVKASRYITHMKKLKSPREPLRKLYERIAVLGGKLGPLLFQLPPNWRFDAKRLEIFLDALSNEHRHAFEFRDSSWFDARAFEMLAEHDTAFCIYELAGQASPREVTADFVYVRLHGPGDAYRGCYDRQTLSSWMEAFSTWRRQRRDVYCYFDNDEAGYAVQNALELESMIPS